MDFKIIRLRNPIHGFIRLLLCMTILVLFSFSIAHSRQENRANLTPEEAIVGRWAMYVKSWHGFGDWKRTETIAEFGLNGSLIYYEKTGVTNLIYSILNQDEINGTIEILVQKPSTGDGHIKYIQFSHDHNVFYEQINMTTKSVRTRHDKTVSMESMNEYLGPSN